MKKSVKVAWKRFIVLLICLVMVMSLFIGLDGIDTTTRIVIGVISGSLVIIYWVYAIISIRRQEQRNKKSGK